MHGINDSDSLTVNWGELCACLSVLAEARAWDTDGTESVARAADEMSEPVQRKHDLVVRVTTKPHTNAEESYTETRHGHEGGPESRIIASLSVRRRSPRVIVHGEKPEVLYGHHRGMENNFWFVFLKRDDRHLEKLMRLTENERMRTCEEMRGPRTRWRRGERGENRVQFVVTRLNSEWAIRGAHPT